MALIPVFIFLLRFNRRQRFFVSPVIICFEKVILLKRSEKLLSNRVFLLSDNRQTGGRIGCCPHETFSVLGRGISEYHWQNSCPNIRNKVYEVTSFGYDLH